MFIQAGAYYDIHPIRTTINRCYISTSTSSQLRTVTS